MLKALQIFGVLSSRIVHGFALAGLWCMTGIVAWQVFARYVLNDSPSWTGQAALLLMIWYVLLGSAAGVREGFHIRIAVFADRLPPRLKCLNTGLRHVLVGLFGCAMIWWGAALIAATSEHTIPALGLGRYWAYVPMPIAGALIALYSLEHLLAAIYDVEVPSTWR